MVKEFIHPGLGQEVWTQGGYYIAREEKSLTYNGREVIYILGHAVIEASCCGAGGWSYIQIPGYFLKRKSPDGSGRPDVSEVEPITEEGDRDSIRWILMEEYPGARIEIW